jgi:hypothetical protein
MPDLQEPKYNHQLVNVQTLVNELIPMQEHATPGPNGRLTFQNQHDRLTNLNNLLRPEHVVLGVGVGIPHALVDLVHRQACNAETRSALQPIAGGRKPEGEKKLSGSERAPSDRTTSWAQALLYLLSFMEQRRW